MNTPKHSVTGWISVREILALLLLAVLVGRTSRVQAGATPVDPIRAFCIDFNWGEGGPNGFARPGLWAEASPEEHVAWYAALGCNRNIAVLARYFTGASLEAIDRQALVKRHNIEWNDPGGQIPLGNGEFCFNADGTGLQTFGGSTMAHWAWHSAPLPPGRAITDLPATGTVEKGRISGPMRQASGRKELDGWMFRNPHPMNLGFPTTGAGWSSRKA